MTLSPPGESIASARDRAGSVGVGQVLRDVLDLATETGDLPLEARDPFVEPGGRLVRLLEEVLQPALDRLSQARRVVGYCGEDRKDGLDDLGRSPGRGAEGSKGPGGVRRRPDRFLDHAPARSTLRW